MAQAELSDDPRADAEHENPKGGKAGSDDKMWLAQGCSQSRIAEAAVGVCLLTPKA